MGEEGALRLEEVTKPMDFLKVRVAVVGLAAQGVEDEEVEVLEEWNALGRENRSCQ